MTMLKMKSFFLKKKKLFDLIMTYMTSDDRSRSKMKALKIYWYVYQITGFQWCWFQKWSPFCKKSLLDLTWPPWPLKIDLRWSIMVAHQPYWYVYQTICFKWWSGQKWCQILEKKKVFWPHHDLIITSMTSDDHRRSKMKTLKI